MANKAKEMASAALTELQQLVRRDAHGRQLVATVSHFVVDLRRSLAIAKDEAAQHKEIISAVDKNRDALKQQIEELKQQLDIQTAAASRATLAAQQAAARVAELEQNADGGSVEDVIPTDPDMTDEETRRAALTNYLRKQIHRRVRRVPQIYRHPGVPDVLFFHGPHFLECGPLGQAVKYDWTALGMFVIYCGLQGLAIGFRPQPLLTRQYVQQHRQWLVDGIFQLQMSAIDGAYKYSGLKDLMLNPVEHRLSTTDL